jgi:protein dithiol oxidoreductase (disulfide-forming)
MKPFRALLLSLMLLPLAAQAQMRWQEGRNYVQVPRPTLLTSNPGKIEVVEVFSYGCSACYSARNEMEKLRKSLPADAVMEFVHASFRPDEAWPMYQRAYYTARALGVAEATHDQVFVSTWETGEIPLLDPKTRGIRNPLPTIEDAARFYARFSSVKAADFLKTASSPEVNAQIQRAEALMRAWQIPSTPTIIVNGRYRIDNSTLSSWDELRQMVNYLVNLERARLKQPATPKP